MLNHKNTANRFSTAPTIKNKVVEPVHAKRYGNNKAVMKAPMLPAMFMVPETAPACFFPISTQKDQDGGRVISAPKMARLKKRIAPIAESI